MDNVIFRFFFGSTVYITFIHIFKFDYTVSPLHFSFILFFGYFVNRFLWMVVFFWMRMIEHCSLMNPFFAVFSFVVCIPCRSLSRALAFFILFD